MLTTTPQAFLQDGRWVFGPDERRRMTVPLGDVGLDVPDEGADVVERPAPDGLAREDAEPRFDISRSPAQRHHTWCRNRSLRGCMGVGSESTPYNVCSAQSYQMYRELTLHLSHEIVPASVAVTASAIGTCQKIPSRSAVEGDEGDDQGPGSVF